MITITENPHPIEKLTHSVKPKTPYNNSNHTANLKNKDAGLIELPITAKISPNKNALKRPYQAIANTVVVDSVSTLQMADSKTATNPSNVITSSDSNSSNNLFIFIFLRISMFY